MSTEMLLPRATVVALALLSFATAILANLCAPGYTGKSLGVTTTLLVWIAALPWLGLLGSWSGIASLFAFLAPLAVCEALLALRYHATINSHTLTIMLGTDRHEAWNYLSSAWPAIIAAASFFLSGVWAAWRLRTAAIWSWRERLQWLPHCILGLVSVSAVLWIVVPAEITPNNGDVTSPLMRTFERVFPWGLPSRLLSFARERQRMRDQIALSKDFKFDAVASNTPRIVVLVIGESSRASSWQLGGYARETNLRLSKRQGVVWMRDYAANAVSTAESVPLMITRRKVGASAGEFAERSIVSAFKEAGYDTWWISNQSTAGIHDLLIASYAQEADHVHFLNLSDHENRGAFDSALLPQLRTALTSGAEKVFIVMHLMGSHYAYWDRYPQADAYFPSGNTEAERWQNSYDNSIRHTDLVLDDAIAMLVQDGRPATLIYASDHGELLITPDCDKRWHGHGVREDVFASALVWLSEHEENKLKAKALEHNASMPVSGKDLFGTLLDAGEIQVTSGELHGSWLEQTFRARPRQVSTFTGLASADLPDVGVCGLLTK